MCCQSLDIYEIESEESKNCTSQSTKEYCNLRSGGGTLQPYQPKYPMPIHCNEYLAMKTNKI